LLAFATLPSYAICSVQTLTQLTVRRFLVWNLLKHKLAVISLTSQICQVPLICTWWMGAGHNYNILDNVK